MSDSFGDGRMGDGTGGTASSGTSGTASGGTSGTASSDGTAGSDGSDGTASTGGAASSGTGGTADTGGTAGTGGADSGTGGTAGTAGAGIASGGLANSGGTGTGTGSADGGTGSADASSADASSADASGTGGGGTGGGGTGGTGGDGHGHDDGHGDGTGDRVDPALPKLPPPETHHRNVQGGTARAAVFGVSDGLVSNVALILGVAGASPGAGVVRLAGLAGLISGAVSMSAGEWVSMTAQTELLERELEMEAIELRRHPQGERQELVQIYRSRGVEPETAERLATEMMRSPELALETHAREELGINPKDLGSPIGAAVSSFLAFAVGAIVPLFPWLFGAGTGALVASILLAAAGALAVGAALARFTGRSVARSALRQLALTAAPAAITYVIGSIVGVGVG